MASSDVVAGRPAFDAARIRSRLRPAVEWVTGIRSEASPAGITIECGPFDVPVAQIDEVGNRIEYGYDTELRLITVTNPAGAVWSYTYDTVGRLVEQSDFDGRTSRYTYEPAGRLIAHTNPAGDTNHYTYDPLGRVVQRRIGELITRLEFDGEGRLTVVASPDAVVRFEHDREGRVTAETINGHTVRTSYDGDRALTRTTASGHCSRWSLDERGQPLTLDTAGHQVRFSYDAAGREVCRTVDGAVTLRQTFDEVGRLTGQCVADSTLLGYCYDAADRVTAVGERSFHSDETGRIRAVTSNGVQRERYDYDQAGNLVAAGGGRWEFDGTMLLRSDDAQFEYDVKGRLTTRIDSTGTCRFTWDAEDRLVTASTPDGDRWRYRYDGFGRRIAKQRLGDDDTVVEEVRFSWTGDLMIEQTGPAGTISWDYLPDGSTPVTQTHTDTGLQIVVTNLIGTPTALVDPTGEVHWTSHGTLWGRVGDPAGTPLRFPGQYHDTETGLHYNRFRYYDPATARYLSPDPLGLTGGLNPTAYVSDPLTRTDPLGLASCNPRDSDLRSRLNRGPQHEDTEHDNTRTGSPSSRYPTQLPAAASPFAPTPAAPNPAPQHSNPFRPRQVSVFGAPPTRYGSTPGFPGPATRGTGLDSFAAIRAALDQRDSYPKPVAGGAGVVGPVAHSRQWFARVVDRVPRVEGPGRCLTAVRAAAVGLHGDGVDGGVRVNAVRDDNVVSTVLPGVPDQLFGRIDSWEALHARMTATAVGTTAYVLIDRPGRVGHALTVHRAAEGVVYAELLNHSGNRLTPVINDVARTPNGVYLHDAKGRQQMRLDADVQLRGLFVDGGGRVVEGAEPSSAVGSMTQALVDPAGRDSAGNRWGAGGPEIQWRRFRVTFPQHIWADAGDKLVRGPGWKIVLESTGGVLHVEFVGDGGSVLPGEEYLYPYTKEQVEQNIRVASDQLEAELSSGEPRPLTDIFPPGDFVYPESGYGQAAAVQDDRTPQDPRSQDTDGVQTFGLGNLLRENRTMMLRSSARERANIENSDISAGVAAAVSAQFEQHSRGRAAPGDRAELEDYLALVIPHLRATVLPAIHNYRKKMGIQDGLGNFPKAYVAMLSRTAFPAGRDELPHPVQDYLKNHGEEIKARINATFDPSDQYVREAFEEAGALVDGHVDIFADGVTTARGGFRHNDYANNALYGRYDNLGRPVPFVNQRAFDNIKLIFDEMKFVNGVPLWVIEFRSILGQADLDTTFQRTGRLANVIRAQQPYQPTAPDVLSANWGIYTENQRLGTAIRTLREGVTAGSIWGQPAINEAWANLTAGQTNFAFAQANAAWANTLAADHGIDTATTYEDAYNLEQEALAMYTQLTTTTAGPPVSAGWSAPPTSGPSSSSFQPSSEIAGRPGWEFDSSRGGWAQDSSTGSAPAMGGSERYPSMRYPNTSSGYAQSIDSGTYGRQAAAPAQPSGWYDSSRVSALAGGQFSQTASGREYANPGQGSAWVSSSYGYDTHGYPVVAARSSSSMPAGTSGPGYVIVPERTEYPPEYQQG
jgi:RHS repeat-associated protein